MTALALGVATVATGFSSNVQADTTVTVTKENVGDQTKITTTTKMTGSQQSIDNTKKQISSQQSIVDGDKALITSAQSKVNHDQSNVVSAQKVVNQKKDNLVSAQSAVRNVQKKQQVNSNSDKDSSNQMSAQNKVNQDQNLVSTQQSIVNHDQSQQLNAKKINDQAKNVLINAEQRNADAQQKVSDDQKQIDDIRQTISQDSSKINNQQKVVNNDQQKVTEDQNQINQNNTQYQADQKQLQSDQQILNSAKQTLTSADNFVNDTKNKLNALQNQNGNMISNQIKIPSGYITSLLDQVQSGNLTSSENVQKKTINGIVMNEHYKHNPTAAKQIVNANDLTHLSSSNQIELNQYVANLINSVRNQMGLQPLTVTDGSIKLAQEVAEQYNEYDNNKGWNVYSKMMSRQFPHYVQGLQNVARQNNMPISNPGENASTSIFGEETDQIEKKSAVLGNLHTDNSTDPSQWEYDPKSLIDAPLTMDDLEENAYNTIIYMLFSDKESYFDHAKNFTELNGNMGVSFDNLGQLHFEFYPSNAQGRLGNTPISTNNNQDNSRQINALQKQLAQQQEAVVQAQKNVDLAQQKVNDDQDRLNQNIPSKLQDQLSKDQAQLLSDENLLNNYQNQLANDKQTLINAQSNLDKDQTMAFQVQNYLANATQALNISQSNLDSIHNMFINDQSKLNSLKQQLVDDQLALVSLQRNQKPSSNTLTNAQRILEQAQKDYNNAVQSLVNLQAQENSDRAILDQLYQKYMRDLLILNQLENQLNKEEQTTVSSSVQWVRHPYTTSEIGDRFVLGNACDHDHHDSDDMIVSNFQKVNGLMFGNEPQKGQLQKTTTPINSETNSKFVTVASNDDKSVNNYIDKISSSVLCDEHKVANVEKNDPALTSNHTTFTGKKPVTSIIQNSSLPQTGDKCSSETIWGEVLLTITGFFGTFGLAGKKRRNK